MLLLLLVTLSCLATVKAQPTPCCMETAWSAKVFDVRAPFQGNNNERYTILANGTCTKDVPIDVLLPKCIPNDSADIGSSYIGTESSGMKSNNWVVINGSINITMGVTDPDCVLTYLGVNNPAASPTDTELYFNGYKTGTTDPTAFDIPISCE
ncbi:uncharacterized protein LOC124273539 isoform X4 [Haliotis rubra]|uniref:uncharacterized protein LOC124273539 isoform X4 n=1 Tax=Haliotis rubra TaxID=36100 RepID=UPI001EE510AE|nr:uncharacterized protein LOC124273539 isoform X4 [Haliotis rubra]